MSPTIEAIDFKEALRERRDRVYAYLESWPGIEEIRPAHMREAILSYVRRRGKGLRPALLMLSCSAMGGDENQALPAAAAVEVFHIWTLVHDDIIDRDHIRWSHPTVHAEFTSVASEQFGLAGDPAAHYGTSVAILAGDLQQSWSYALLCDLATRDVPPSLVVELIRRMATSLTPQLMEGEMLDVQFSLPGSHQPSTGAQVLDMLEKKTGALLEYAAWAGARIGVARSGGDSKHADTLGQFARLCGLAFQLRDDVLGLTADERLLGKPVGSDLREGKQTYIVSCAVERASAEERAELARTLGNKHASPGDVQRAVDIMRSVDALSAASRLADEYIDRAINLLDTLPPTDQRELLRAWAGFLVARDY